MSVAITVIALVLSLISALFNTDKPLVFFTMATLCLVNVVVLAYKIS